ncbi:MAG TPA: hypothetical protein VI072_10275 [Polyangiaceae bacterium]
MLRAQGPRRRTVRALLLAFGLTLSEPALAQQPFDIDSPTPSPPAPSGTEQAVVTRYWELGRPRLFLATMAEGGYAYVRPRFALGYGQPYWRWIGIEAYPLLSLSGLGQYVGLGGAVPGLTARVGARYTYPLARDYLEPRSSYDRLDLELRKTEPAKYLALEAEVAATVPVLVGSMFAIVTAYRVELVPADLFVFEENLRQIMEPPYIWRARLGYLVGFGKDGSIRIGAAAEYIGIPGREEHVVRAGVLGSVLINAHLEAQASLIPVILSPDRLGLAGGDFGQLGVRFHWATGSKPDPKRVRQVLIDREKRRAKERGDDALPEEARP